MPNDDLGTFPMPPKATDNPPSEPVSSPVPAASEPPVAAPQPTAPAPAPEPAQPTEPPFEETPEELPSVQSTPTQSPDLAAEEEKISFANEELINKQTQPTETMPEPPVAAPQPTAPAPAPEPAQPTEVPAVAPQTGRSAAPAIIIVLLLVAGVALAAAVYLSQQTNKLKSQLSEISSTLEKQQTTLTPTATPTVFEIPTPTLTPAATPSAIATPTATPTVSVINKLQPLTNASSALKIALNHSPNAQLILIKVDNASNTDTAVTKYFFREDLTTKKYFYVAITGTGTPEVIDKQIYVTPDDNIPSLNEAVLGNQMGIELDAALKLAYSQCANQNLCTSSSIKAQYIKTGTGIIWQISLYTKGLSSSPLIVQINATTQAILYRSPELANK